MTGPAVELLGLEDASIGYGRPLLPPIRLGIRSHERLAVLGPNGGGKSTLLRTLLGLKRLLAGRRVVRAGPRLRLGYVPQAHRTDPVYPLSAFEVTLHGRMAEHRFWRPPGKADRSAAEEALASVGLADVARRPFRELSGGQRQRVLLARALAGAPEVLVLDEFTSELDPAAGSALLGEVAALSADRGTAVIFVTHELQAALRIATHVAFVDAHHQKFEHGPRETLLTGERLSALYGRTVELHVRGDRTLVFIEAEGCRP